MLNPNLKSFSLFDYKIIKRNPSLVWHLHLSSSCNQETVAPKLPSIIVFLTQNQFPGPLINSIVSSTSASAKAALQLSDWLELDQAQAGTKQRQKSRCTVAVQNLNSSNLIGSNLNWRHNSTKQRAEPTAYISMFGSSQAALSGGSQIAAESQQFYSIYSSLWSLRSIMTHFSPYDILALH